jgi:hypothetical protein
MYGLFFSSIRYVSLLSSCLNKSYFLSVVEEIGKIRKERNGNARKIITGKEMKD